VRGTFSGTFSGGCFPKVRGTFSGTFSGSTFSGRCFPKVRGTFSGSRCFPKVRGTFSGSTFSGTFSGSTFSGSTSPTGTSPNGPTGTSPTGTSPTGGCRQRQPFSGRLLSSAALTIAGARRGSDSGRKRCSGVLEGSAEWSMYFANRTSIEESRR
jgi:hypothetical protein